jgi:hypothetical protein
MAYLEKHWKTFLRSFKLDALAFKLLVTDMLFILTLMLAYSVLYAFWMRNLLGISALLGIESGGMPAASSINTLKVWNAFAIKTIIILVVSILLYILLISLYSAFSHTFINRKNFTLKLFLNFISIYSLSTLLYLTLITIMFFISQNIILIAWCILIITMIYLYMLLIFYLVTNDGKFLKIVRHGLKSMIRLHDTLIPLVLGFILMTLATIVIELLFGKFLALSVILLLLAFLYLATWLKKYLHHVIHEI